MERGPQHVRVDDIADAAGVSPRTYNNYFSSRDQAIVAGLLEDRAERIAADVLGRPAGVRLSEVVTDAVVMQYANPGDEARDALLMITTNPGLRECYADAADSLAEPLSDVLTRRMPQLKPLAARVLAAGVGAAVKVAVREWLDSGTTDALSESGFVVVSASLPDVIREALMALAPAIDASAGEGS